MKVLRHTSKYHCISKILNKRLQPDIFARCGRKISPPLLDLHSVSELDAVTLRALIAEKYSLSNVRQCYQQCSMATDYWLESRKQQVNCVQGRPDK